jgi:hypothetical protein
LRRVPSVRSTMERGHVLHPQHHVAELCLPLVHAVAGTQVVQVRRQPGVGCSSSGRQKRFVGRSGDCVTRLVGRQDLLRGTDVRRGKARGPQ